MRDLFTNRNTEKAKTFNALFAPVFNDDDGLQAPHSPDVPVFKQGKKEDPSIYRPVSLTSVSGRRLFWELLNNT